MSWLDDRIAKDMKDPEFRKAWDKYEPEFRVIQYLLDHDIPFTQEFLDILDELTEKGVVMELIPIEKTKETKELQPELEYA